MPKSIVIKPKELEGEGNPTIEFTGSLGGTARIEVSPTGDIEVSNGSSSSSSTFYNVAKFNSGISGSLTRLHDGTSYLRGGIGINVSTGSSGAITFGIIDSVVATISGSRFTGDVTSTGNVTAETDLRSVYSSGNEGGQIFLNKAATNTSIVNGVQIDVYQDRLRFFEHGGTSRGFFIEMASGSAGVNTPLSSTTSIQNFITLGATTTAPGTGTRTIQRIESQRVGDKITLTYRLGQTQASAGTGDYLLTLPAGMNFNSTYNSTYSGVIWSGGVNQMALYFIPSAGLIVTDSNWTSSLAIVPYDSTRFRVAIAHAQNSGMFVFWSSSLLAVSAGTGVMAQLSFEIWA
jgi:hypothetical protein